MPNVSPPGPSSSGEDETRLSGARAEFVGSLPRRLDALRSALRSAEQMPSDPERSKGLLRRVHAVGAAARVLGFASVAEALTEAEKTVRKATAAGRPAPLEEVARALDLLPSLVLGAPVSLRQPETRERAPAPVWPISVLIYGGAVLAEALGDDDDETRIERERTEDAERARELARIVGPDVVIVDADRPGSRELVAELVNDPLVEPAPIVVVGTLEQPEAAGSYVELGAARVLLKPCSPDTLKRTVEELRDRATKPQKPRDPLGSVTVPALADRIAGEFRRGLVEALEGSQAAQVSLGEGHDVLAAVWGAVARVRELVTLHSAGGLRFQPTGPEGAVPFAPFRGEERRAGERGSGEGRSAEGVSLNGRRIVVADDDPAVVWFMAGLLKAVGVEVIEAHDGKQALELTYSRFPDVIISDVLMPKLDGFSLCHEIKRDVAVRDVPVILLSWKEDLLQRVRELGADADGYLRKEAAASAVVERVREVLHPRARIEERMRAGGEVRGRLDGLTPRLILDLACGVGSDLRVSIRDAAFLYEVQVRGGGVRSVTRSSPDGAFSRGESVLSSLLGVSAGRFVVETDSSPCRNEFSGDLDAVLSRPIALARSALGKVAERTLLRLERLELDRELVEAYLACTPEPAARLTRRLLAGESARELVLSGEVAPRLLEAILSDIARRGGVRDAVLSPSPSGAPRAAEPSLTDEEVRSAPPPAVHESAGADATASDAVATASDGALDAGGRAADEQRPDSDSRPSIPHGASVVNREDVGWFSLAVEPSAEPPAVEGREGIEEAPFTTSEPPLRVVGSENQLPLSDQATPGDWQAGPLFAFGGEHSTLPGVGTLPAVGERTPSSPEDEVTGEPAEKEPALAAPEAKAAKAAKADAEVVEAAPTVAEPAPIVAEPAPIVAEPAATEVAATGDTRAVPTPAESTAPEPPGIELGAALLDAPDDDDDRATFPIPERSPLAERPTASPSPLPEPPVPDERQAPTQPPSRVARKPARAQDPAPATAEKAKESVAGFLVKSVLAAGAAFLATSWLVPKLFPDPESTAQDPAPAAVAPPPAAASAPVTSPSEATSGLALRAEAIETPAGVTLDSTQGLVDVEPGEVSAIEVDGAFVGRFEKRRLLLAPGAHRVAVENDRGKATLELDVVAGRALRVVSSGDPANASRAAPSAE
jgi:DNA-binding response OmpR family regulator